MNGLQKIFLNDDGKLTLSEEIREIADWNIGEKIFVRYNEELDLLELRSDANVFELQENGVLMLSNELIEIASLFKDNELVATFDEQTDLLTLKPINKLCVICENEHGTINVAEDKYICENCQSKLLSMQKTS